MVCNCPITICSNLENDPSPTIGGSQDIYAKCAGSIPHPTATTVVALVPAPSSS